MSTLKELQQRGLQQQKEINLSGNQEINNEIILEEKKDLLKEIKKENFLSGNDPALLLNQMADAIKGLPAPPKLIPVSLRLPEELDSLLESHCHVVKRKKGQVVQDALRLYLATYEQLKSKQE